MLYPLHGKSRHVSAQYNSGWSDNCAMSRVVLCAVENGKMDEKLYSCLSAAARHNLMKTGMRNSWDDRVAANNYYVGFMVCNGHTYDLCSQGCVDNIFNDKGKRMYRMIDACHPVAKAQLFSRKLDLDWWIPQREYATTIVDEPCHQTIVDGLFGYDKLSLAFWTWQSITAFDVERDPDSMALDEEEKERESDAVVDKPVPRKKKKRNSGRKKRVHFE